MMNVYIFISNMFFFQLTIFVFKLYLSICGDESARVGQALLGIKRGVIV